MKKIILIIVVVASSLYIISCGKSSDTGSGTTCTNTLVTADSAALLSFAGSNSITTTKDPSGLYYQIITSGTGTTTPIGNSLIEVSYKGTLLNGKVFDSTAAGKTATFPLYNLIAGWQIAIPKIKAGGRIKMLVPSALAYGCQGAGTTIAPNTPIYFDVTLVGVQ